MFNPDYENLPSFKSFVSRQPSDTRYPYSNSGDCACARWLKSEDRFVTDWLSHPENREMNTLAQGDMTGGDPISKEWTFGKLLERINAKEKELA